MEKSLYICGTLVFLLYSFNISSAKTITNLTSDEYALLAFKSQITNDPFNILTNNWTTTTTICNWVGVTCGHHHQRVTALNLEGMDLHGTITPHLGNLTFLKYLNLDSNNFRGIMPQEFTHLRRLEEIYIQYNLLSGNLPSWFDSLPRLRYLYLSHNNFSGIIPLSICNISTLEMLFISQNSLQGPIPKHIGNLSRLNKLYLGNNLLTGSIPHAIFKMTTLQQIDLGFNMLNDNLPVDVCDNHSGLQKLGLHANRLHGEIPSNLEKCKELQYLSLSYNDEINGKIPREIGNLTSLIFLYLAYTNLTGEIPLEIGNLKSLTHFIITQTDLKVKEWPSFMFNMSSLEVLDMTEIGKYSTSPRVENIQINLPLLEELYLNSNGLTGQIPLGLLGCTRLQILSMTSNKLTGHIPKTIGNLTSLKQLHLSQNFFTGTLPDELGKLNLEALAVNINNFSGPIPPNIFNISTMKNLELNANHFIGHLPSNLGNSLPNLEKLYLSYNKLSSIIPNSIGNASKLTLLDMTGNPFTGLIPNTLGNLRFLKRLFLSENNLTSKPSSLEIEVFSSLTNCRDLEVLSLSQTHLNGILPTSIGNLSTNLQFIEAFDSKIKGEIPVSIGNLTNLNKLSLDNNALTGPIPRTIRELKHMERIYLEHNKLDGPVPSDICLLKKLGDLYLSDNMFNGSIPTCLGELMSLRYMYLDSNKLSSTIPSALWKLEDLLGLNLSTNFLTGYLPLDIKSFKVITQIDLSCNQLSGNIPKIIGDVQTLSSLSLAHNKFEGSIPQSLGHLINLELLDLSNNNLSGEIPLSCEDLRYLKHFNVSFNRLEGEVPNGGGFVNFTALSFIGNRALCGAPRFHLEPCKSKTVRQLGTSIGYLLRYILPPVILATLIVAIMLVWTRRKKHRLIKKIDSLTCPLRRISYYELFRATNAFCEGNLIGRGSVGSVYKGTLTDGITVAIKVFSLTSEAALRSFDVECEVIRRIRHRNLIKVISSCTNYTDFKALVLEYLPNGSLDRWLYSHNYCLTMIQRLNIMVDVATALEYLHNGQTTPIVHCDLKPSNVLLDEDMIAHVCDFGISKLFGEREFMLQTRTLATMGYMAPEYGAEGIISTKVDVYSYGVLLMETFTRMKPTDQMFCGEVTLRSWVHDALLLSEGSMLAVVDSNLLIREDENFSINEKCVSSVLSLAMDCSATSPTERLSMEDVLIRIKKIISMYLANIA